MKFLTRIHQSKNIVVLLILSMFTSSTSYAFPWNISLNNIFSKNIVSSLGSHLASQTIEAIKENQMAVGLFGTGTVIAAGAAYGWKKYAQLKQVEQEQRNRADSLQKALTRERQIGLKLLLLNNRNNLGIVERRRVQQPSELEARPKVREQHQITLDDKNNEIRQLEERLEQERREKETIQNTAETLKEGVRAAKNGVQEVQENVIEHERQLNNRERQLNNIVKGPNPHDHPFVQAGIIQIDESGKERVASDSLQYSLNDLPDIYEEVTIDGDKDGWKLVHAQYNNYRLRHKRIRPSALSRGRILLVCIHGTWSNDASFGGKDNEPTQHIKYFGHVLAQVYDCSVDIISFTWSGALDINHRQEAAGILAKQLIKTINTTENNTNQIWTIAHSHGCNVVNIAAEELKNINRTIDVGIHVGSPIQDIKSREMPGDVIVPEDAILNIKKIYHFYSTSDITQAVGSFETNRRNFERRGAQFNLSGTNRIYNIRIQQDGKELNHINIKLPVFSNLVTLIYEIDTYYSCHFDLDANVFSEGLYPLVAIRRPEHCYPHVFVAPNIHRSRQRSENSTKLFSDKYGYNIADKRTNVVQKMIGEGTSILTCE